MANWQMAKLANSNGKQLWQNSKKRNNKAKYKQ
jgi:hypothetical protein